jgi:hypothetical protein
MADGGWKGNCIRLSIRYSPFATRYSPIHFARLHHDTAALFHHFIAVATLV